MSEDNLTIAVLRVRGAARVNKDIKNTLERLKLFAKNNCVLIKDTPDMLGMVKKVKDYVTWGVIDEETKNAMIEKRGKKDNEGKVMNNFQLCPPVGGFERKGVKKAFSIGGALGNRKEKINDLIKKML